MSQVSFIWGAGGVGKSHVAIRKVVEAHEPALLMTLDPSRRIFELLHRDLSSKDEIIRWEDKTFRVRATDDAKLFENISRKTKASPTVRAFYDQMSKGLQDFHDYLSLVQLSNELRNSDFKAIVVDTPPFQEAIGLHRSIFNLRNFFEQSLVQFALKSTNFSPFKFSWVHAAIKKAFEATRIFIGKKAASEVFDFMEWLTQNLNQFSGAAVYLEKLISSPDTNHIFVITPETKSSFLDEIRQYFLNTEAKISFVLNRSVSVYKIPEELSTEFVQLQKREALFLSILRSKFKDAKVDLIPYLLMGDDSLEELRKFVSISR